MKKIVLIMAVLLSSFGSFAQNKNNSMIQYKKIQVEDCRVFYREAGDASEPTILLLHGFPSSSHMFRELMPELMEQREQSRTRLSYAESQQNLTKVKSQGRINQLWVFLRIFAVV